MEQLPGKGCSDPNSLYELGLKRSFGAPYVLLVLLGPAALPVVFFLYFLLLAIYFPCLHLFLAFPCFSFLYLLS